MLIAAEDNLEAKYVFIGNSNNQTTKIIIYTSVDKINKEDKKWRANTVNGINRVFYHTLDNKKNNE
jgi:hypothetical protein